MTILSIFRKSRSVTLFFLLAIIIAGAVAYLTLGRAEDPTFTIKIFTVTGPDRADTLTDGSYIFPQVEFVAQRGDPATDWYVDQFGGGCMILAPSFDRVFGQRCNFAVFDAGRVVR
jgi:hypothetical protein